MRDWIWKMMIGSSPIVVVILLKYVAIIRRRTYIRGEKVDEIEVARLVTFTTDRAQGGEIENGTK
jgi:hypothetical protein